MRSQKKAAGIRSEGERKNDDDDVEEEDKTGSASAFSELQFMIR